MLRPKAVAVGLRIRLYGAKRAWIADEIVNDAGSDAPILSVAGLVDAAQVASVSCSVDGYSAEPDTETFISTAPALAPGRKRCLPRNGLDVDGGPDADFEAALIGRNWIAARFYLFINRFLGDQETDFTGDVFAASLDRGPAQKIVIYGQDGQPLSYFFSNMHPGLHQINYGPWTVDDTVPEQSPGFSPGYHIVCVRSL